jgi:uncharacterized membrane protein
MSKGRLEAFSDGVIAILITILVLELKVPHGTDLESLRPVLPVFLTYVLSFVYLGIYWNNHHHMLYATSRVSGAILWANLHLLFWLSLVPFMTAWMGENAFAPVPTALYGAVLLMAGVAYYVLEQAILTEHGQDSLLGEALGPRLKDRLSILLYAIAIPSSFLHPAIAGAIYLGVAVMWLVPDPRIERVLARRRSGGGDGAPGEGL